MSKNDDRIIELRAKVEAKRAELKASKPKFAPVTTQVLEFDGTKYNLNVLNEEQLVLLACKLQSLLTAAKDLSGGKYTVMIGGFSIQDWMSDVTGRLDVLAHRAEESKLVAMEKKLATLLSTDKRTELELDEIAASL